MSDYVETALQHAHDQQLTAAEVAAMSYLDFHALAGVDPHAEGQEPFVWEAVRSIVAAQLAQEPQVIVEAENGQTS